MKGEYAQLRQHTGFIHMVYFWPNEGTTEADLKALHTGIKTLEQIETVAAMFIGSPAMTPREVVDNSYAWSLLVLFETKEAHDIYQDHPIHHAFVAACSHLWDRVQVYDSMPHR